MILRFRGSDYRRSSGLTWYGGMEGLLMALGFTESKEDSNLYFKVEVGRLVMLLKYVNDLFLTNPRHVHPMVAKHAMRYLKCNVSETGKHQTNEQTTPLR